MAWMAADVGTAFACGVTCTRDAELRAAEEMLIGVVGTVAAGVAAAGVAAAVATRLAFRHDAGVVTAMEEAEVLIRRLLPLRLRAGPDALAVP